MCQGGWSRGGREVTVSPSQGPGLSFFKPQMLRLDEGNKAIVRININNWLVPKKVAQLWGCDLFTNSPSVWPNIEFRSHH